MEPTVAAAQRRPSDQAPALSAWQQLIVLGTVFVWLSVLTTLDESVDLGAAWLDKGDATGNSRLPGGTPRLRRHYTGTGQHHSPSAIGWRHTVSRMTPGHGPTGERPSVRQHRTFKWTAAS
jgi:hypothetical protein